MWKRERRRHERSRVFFQKMGGEEAVTFHRLLWVVRWGSDGGDESSQGTRWPARNAWSLSARRGISNGRRDF